MVSKGEGKSVVSWSLVVESQLSMCFGARHPT